MDTKTDLLEMTADIAASYVASNRVAADDLPGLIRTIHGALKSVEAGAPEPEAGPAKATAAQIRKSVTPDHIISFEDGRGYKSLRRHLTTRGLTPAEYRAKWGLAKDYPMVAPSYSAARSEMAKSIGLGQKGKGRGKATTAPAKRGPGRPKKA